MTAPKPVRHTGRSVGALVAGLVVGLVLSLGTDAILHVTGAFPPWQQAMTAGQFAIAMTYRVIYSALASYIAARMAPDRPMWHAMLLGVINLMVSLIGTVVTWNRGPEFGPHWYPLSLVVLALPAAWIGGRIYTSGHRDWSATREFFTR